MLYVFGYDINWWKGNGKLLITYVSTKSKEKEKRYKSTFALWKEKKWKVEKKNEKPKKYIMK